MSGQNGERTRLPFPSTGVSPGTAKLNWALGLRSVLETGARGPSLGSHWAHLIQRDFTIRLYL